MVEFTSGDDPPPAALNPALSKAAVLSAVTGFIQ
jgi:hypothetical protein